MEEEEEEEEEVVERNKHMISQEVLIEESAKGKTKK